MDEVHVSGQLVHRPNHPCLHTHAMHVLQPRDPDLLLCVVGVVHV
jgi:hypothetical protein